MAVIDGATSDDRLIGTDGADQLSGGAGNDRLEGRGGDDLLDGGQGADSIDGGAGHDLVTYAHALTPVFVNLAEGWADDGIWRDLLANVEGAIGSIFDDRMIGSAAADNLFGNDGADVIIAGAGDDLVDGGQGDDDLTGGAGNDRFVHSLSDGNDLIRDLGDGDVIEVCGYTAAESISQQGADVLVTLAAGDTIRVSHSTVAFVTARLSFTPQPRALFPPPIVEALLASPGLLIGEGVVLTSLNPLRTTIGLATIADTAVILRGGVLFQTGSIELYSAGDSGDAKALAPATLGTSGGPQGAMLVTGPHALVEVHSESDGWGVIGLADVFNAGLISVVADRTAGGIVDSGVTDASGIHTISNAGTIQVAGNLVSSGIGASGSSPGVVSLIANSGLISVRGASGSAGINAVIADGSALVNRGIVQVTDADLNRHAVGLLLDWRGTSGIWNSGSIRADLGLALSAVPGLAETGATLALTNSGLIEGLVDLSGSGLTGLPSRIVTIVNSGSILGDVMLGPGNDRFDGRAGNLAGSVLGLGGNDVLLAGAGVQHLDGGAGDDALSGGPGDDVLTGGAGADRFRFERGFGRDIITDFTAAEGDRIDVAGFAGWTGVAQEGGDVVVTFGPGDQLVLRGLMLADLNPAWFQFDAPAIPAATIPPPPAVPMPPLYSIRGTDGSDVIVGHDIGDSIDAGTGNDVLTGGLGPDVLSGGAGRDLFRDTLAGHDGDTITDFTIGDRLLFSDADPATFAFTLDGSTLRYPGGTLTLANSPRGMLAASPAAGGGVQLALAAAAPAGTAPLFARSGTPLVASFNFANGWISQTLFPRHVADVNGDGLADVVGFGFAGIWVSYGTVAGGLRAPAMVLGNFGLTAGWISDDRFPRALADLDGDGRADVIGFGQAGTWVALALAGGGFAAPSLMIADFGVQQGWGSQDGFTRLVGDVNGDGKSDLVGFGTAGAWVALGTGDGHFEAARLALPGLGRAQGWTSDNMFHRALGDINGDGAADLVGFGMAGTYVAFARGDGTFADPLLTLRDFGVAQGWASNDAAARIVADVNGDGLADIIGFTRTGATIALGRGDGTFASPRSDVADFGIAQGWGSDALFHREMADLNHDGLLDLVGFGVAGVLSGQNSASLLI